ncbi:MAG: ribonuclease P protein component [Rhodanobacteraceae bacterium]
MSFPAGLPPHARLRRAADFAALRKAPGRLDTRYFLIRFHASAAAGARLGLAISKRVSKSAVQRNRIKRLTRESFRRARDDMPKVDVLVIARSIAAAAENIVLRADLDRVWPRLQALKPGRAPGTIVD